jgi:hypothetical protein
MKVKMKNKTNNKIRVLNSQEILPEIRINFVEQYPVTFPCDRSQAGHQTIASIVHFGL